MGAIAPPTAPPIDPPIDPPMVPPMVPPMDLPMAIELPKRPGVEADLINGRSRGAKWTSRVSKYSALADILVYKERTEESNNDDSYDCAFGYIFSL